MKILILANHLNFGGISGYVVSLCRMLHNQNGVEFVVASRGGDREKDLSDLGVRHIRIPLTTKCEVSPKVFASFLKLRKFLTSSPVDVIHANTRVTQVLAALLSFSAKTPSVSTCHGYFKRRLGRLLFPCWGRKVIAISDQVKDHLMCDFYVDADNIALVYNGVDIEKFRPHVLEEILREKKRFGLDPDKKVIGHVGRLSSVKGQRFLILAMEILLRERKDLQGLIIGDGKEEKPLRRLIRERGLEASVFLHPSVSDTSLALATMDVFAMPSLQEGLGISILEAQAQGIPVVASRVGGIPSVIEDGVSGLLVDSGDAQGMAAAIERLLDDGVLKERLVAHARSRVCEKFSLKIMAQETLSAYQSLC